MLGSATDQDVWINGIDYSLAGNGGPVNYSASLIKYTGKFIKAIFKDCVNFLTVRRRIAESFFAIAISYCN